MTMIVSIIFGVLCGLVVKAMAKSELYVFLDGGPAARTFGRILEWFAAIGSALIAASALNATIVNWR